MEHLLTGLYLHIPFCLKKCPYCDFNSYPLEKDLAARYVTALRREIKVRGSQFPGPVSTVYLGGGTPTCLESAQIDSVLSECYNSFEIRQDAEVTIEANPGTLTGKNFFALKKSGVNRVSLGVQSFRSSLLEKLERIHDASEALSAFYAAREAGFDNIGLDLIFGIPDQVLADWEADLEQTLVLSPEHVSVYGLTVEPETPFAQLQAVGRLMLPGETMERNMMRSGIKLLTEAGFEHYEISNFARPGKRSQHNQLYWKDQNYLGLGAGAHSSGEGARFWNEADPTEYCSLVETEGAAEVGRETLSLRRRLGEVLMLGLRMMEGVSLSELERRYGFSLMDEFDKSFDKLTSAGLLRFDGDRLLLTEEGMFLANEVFLELL